MPPRLPGLMTVVISWLDSQWGQQVFPIYGLPNANQLANWSGRGLSVIPIVTIMQQRWFNAGMEPTCSVELPMGYCLVSLI